MEATKSAIAVPETAEGEIYVGLIGDQHGNAYHLILLPGDDGERDWKKSKEWAASIGGDLPSRLEQAMLWANCRGEFKREWYWSNEAEGSGWAWFQYFTSGYQDSSALSSTGCAPEPSADCPLSNSVIPDRNAERTQEHTARCLRIRSALMRSSANGRAPK